MVIHVGEILFCLVTTPELLEEVIGESESAFDPRSLAWKLYPSCAICGHAHRPGSPLSTEFIAGRIRFVRAGAPAIFPNERPPFGCVLLIWSGPGESSPLQNRLF